MSEVRICLVEDDEQVASFVKKGLTEQGYEVEHAPDVESAKKLVQHAAFQLLLIDIMLANGSNGIELCRYIRQQDDTLPILMLTALGTTDDKVAGLKAGADDYLVKPFHFAELLARIEALLRRRRAEEKQSRYLSYADLTLDTWNKTAQRSGKSIALTAKEYVLLELFLKNPDKLLSRQYIADKAWGIHFDTGTNIIDVYVNYVRNKVDKSFGDKLIHTVIGMGYILKSKK
ncbi:response regulator transcription factor [Pedobacter sp. BS3]|uniref:response regulator transcription factor n=1 Tax=Pedobacter sp. BS3 TaxID=2567937 RepID=UPI0011EFEBDA|nr:response regulator transcription factor [Pedobacter sp. BS3]TZF83616.1 response regulator transcription factor [Pedobacter sp. BS3]